MRRDGHAARASGRIGHEGCRKTWVVGSGDLGDDPADHRAGLEFVERARDRSSAAWPPESVFSLPLRASSTTCFSSSTLPT